MLMTRQRQPEISALILTWFRIENPLHIYIYIQPADNSVHALTRMTLPSRIHKEMEKSTF